MSSSRRINRVVLRKHVPIFDAEEKEQENAILARATKDWAGVKDGSWILDHFSLDAHLVEPPELSTLYLRAKIEARERGIKCIFESMADNFLLMTLLLGDSDYGLVYDGAKNTLSLLPRVPGANTNYFMACLMEPTVFPVPFELLERPAVLPRKDGSYDLLNVGFFWEKYDGGWQRSRRGILFRWSSRGPAEWKKQKARLSPQTRLPREHPERPLHEADVVFTFKGKVFWADLLHGAIVCDMISAGTRDDDHVELDFIHLPEECQGRDFWNRCPNPKEHRTMGPVRDSIKFISIVTADGETPRDNTRPADVVLRSWTLAPDLRSWTRDDDMELPLTQLLESEAYKRQGLPAAVPQHPYLKADEEGVLYLSLGDYYVDKRRRPRLCMKVEYVISINMRRKTLLSHSHIKDGFAPPKGKMNRLL
ncbi:unnamed protein product [Triticum turgidum subsp. durum]|uniref:DUF1618 domain-containing protein n=1 Tax=Triticum turgidum subsp. durum TaxID=4567 RepID=A0A9R0XLD5_TRITD|nr:unnamed protein product [Triticum turgidum subsp. durum]